MKKLNYWVIAIVAVITLSISGCKKEIEPILPIYSDAKIYLPVKIFGEGITVTYSYLDNSGILAELTSKLGTDASTYRISYNTSKQPIEGKYCINGVVKKEIEYVLNATGEVIRGSAFEVNDGIPGALLYYYTLTYDNLNRLKRVIHYDANGQLNTEESYEYSSEGIIIKINYEGDVAILEYDNFNGIGLSVKNSHLYYLEIGDYMIFNNKNNLTKLAGTIRTYKYNEDKYPVEMAIVGADRTYNFTIDYFVK